MVHAYHLQRPGSPHLSSVSLSQSADAEQRSVSAGNIIACGVTTAMGKRTPPPHEHLNTLLV